MNFRKPFLCLFAVATILVSAGVARADLVTFAGSSGNLAASASFSLSGTTLTVTLSNTSMADVLAPADVLTGLFFSTGTHVLSPVSAIVATGTTVWFGPDGGGNVGGEWAYEKSKGISSSGFGIFGDSNFNGSELQGPEKSNAVDGVQYGITSAGDNSTTGNKAVTETNALIHNVVVFTLSTPSNFLLSDIDVTGVSFQYGTGLSEPNFPGVLQDHTTPTPIPGALILLGPALLGLVGFRKRIWK
jgi:hypothetical protein